MIGSVNREAKPCVNKFEDGGSGGRTSQREARGIISRHVVGQEGKGSCIMAAQEARYVSLEPEEPEKSVGGSTGPRRHNQP